MRRPLTYAAFCVVLLAAPACQSEPEPRFAAPSDSPSVSPSATASASPTAEPEALTPEQTVRAWVDAYNKLLTSGDLSQIRRLTSASCSTCNEFVSGIDVIVESGGEIRTDGWTIRGLTRDDQTSSKSRPVMIGNLVQSEGETIPSAGAEPFDFPFRTDSAAFELQKRGDTWAIDYIYFRR